MQRDLPPHGSTFRNVFTEPKALTKESWDIFVNNFIKNIAFSYERGSIREGGTTPNN